MLLRSVEVEPLHPDPRHTTVEARCDPTLVVNRSVAEDLEVLRGAVTQSICCEGVAHGHSVQRDLVNAIHCLGNRNTRGLENCWNDIDHMMELRSQSTFVGNCAWPFDSESVSCPPKV